MANVTYDPYVTTRASGSFSVTSEGVTQGVAMDDPTVRNLLAYGYISTSETLPMWGGIAVQELIGLRPGAGVRGNELKRSTAVGNITGFTVYNQSHHLITYPGSPAPSGGSGMSIGFYRLGSKARIPLKASSALINDVGELVTQNVSYDFAAGHVVPYLPNNVSLTASSIYWSSGVTPTTNVPNFVTVNTSADHGLETGAYVTVSGFTPSGYNGTFEITVTSPTQFTYLLADDPGSPTAEGTITADGGILPVRVLQVYSSNARVVEYDPVLNVTRWNNAGDNDSVAVLVEI